MESKDQSFRDTTVEEELERAKWYKEDLDKGGWKQVFTGPGFTYWIKTFPDEEVPVKILYTRDMPMSAKTFAQLMDPKSFELRKKWDDTFKDLEMLEVYPENGRYLIYDRVELSWPISDRGFVLFQTSPVNVDWYGKKAFFIIMKNGWHPSKPENAAGVVMGTNGGNFYLVTTDENNPETACTVFGLTANNFNGWIPKRNMEWLFAKLAPPEFNSYFTDVIKASEMYSEELRE